MHTGVTLFDLIHITGKVARGPRATLLTSAEVPNEKVCAVIYFKSSILVHRERFQRSSLKGEWPFI